MGAHPCQQPIIGLYALGTSTREISELMEEQFGNKISPETIPAITDQGLSELQNWRNRGMDAVYLIMWLYAIHYNVLGLCADGRKGLMGMYIAKSEGANFWLSELTDLQNRGVQDIAWMVCSHRFPKGRLFEAYLFY